MDIITKNKFNFSEFKNEFIRWIDFPSFIQLFLPSFVLLAISGNFKNFWKSVKVAYNDEKLSVTEMNLFVNAIQCLRSLLIFTGIGCTLTGFTGTFFHLKDNSLLGLNIQVALIPCFYSIICCLVLLLLETKILRLADGNE